MRYQTILFDLDHTLLDSDASFAAAFEATMRSIGIADPQSVFVTFDHINNELWRGVERGEVSPNDVKTIRFRRLLDELGVAGDPIEMGDTFVDGLSRHGELFDGAQSLLDGVVGRARLGLVTNGIGKVQRHRLERLGLSTTFDAVVISGEVATSKPGAEIFDRAFEALGVTDRSDAVMVGDNLGSDILGGSNAGIDTIWFNRHGAENTTDVRPTHEAAGLADIAAILV